MILALGNNLNIQTQSKKKEKQYILTGIITRYEKTDEWYMCQMMEKIPHPFIHKLFFNKNVWKFFLFYLTGDKSMSLIKHLASGINRMRLHCNPWNWKNPKWWSSLMKRKDHLQQEVTNPFVFASVLWYEVNVAYTWYLLMLCYTSLMNFILIPLIFFPLLILLFLFLFQLLQFKNSWLS